MKKKFYEQSNFYLAAIALIFTLVALVLYACNCASEFNGGKVSSAVVGGDIIAAVCAALAIVMAIIGSIKNENKLIVDVCNYTRFLKYFSFIALLYTFCMSILAEYSLIGTILYPIFSGTVGDPVEPVLMFSYLVSIMLELIASILFICSAILQRSDFYAEENRKIKSNKARA